MCNFGRRVRVIVAKVAATSQRRCSRRTAAIRAKQGQAVGAHPPRQPRPRCRPSTWKVRPQVPTMLRSSLPARKLPTPNRSLCTSLPFPCTWWADSSASMDASLLRSRQRLGRRSKLKNTLSNTSSNSAPLKVRIKFLECDYATNYRHSFTNTL